MSTDWTGKGIKSCHLQANELDSREMEIPGTPISVLLRRKQALLQQARNPHSFPNPYLQHEREQYHPELPSARMISRLLPLLPQWTARAPLLRYDLRKRSNSCEPKFISRHCRVTIVVPHWSTRTATWHLSKLILGCHSFAWSR